MDNIFARSNVFAIIEYLIRIPYTDYDILNEEYIIKRLNNLDKYDYNNQNFS